jgi:hypothetical protein
LKNQAQTSVDGTQQARRQRASVLGKETAVESEDLPNIDYRIAGKTRRAGRHYDIAWSIGPVEVAGDHRDQIAVIDALAAGLLSRALLLLLFIARFFLNFGGRLIGAVFHLFSSGFGGLRCGFSGVFCCAPGRFAGFFGVLTGLLHVLLGSLSEHEGCARQQ